MKKKRVAAAAAELDEPPQSVIQPAAFYDCKKRDRLVVGTPEHLGQMREAIDKLIRNAGLTLFGSSVERYSDQAHHGYTYLAWIGESAIDIHTWPEYRSAIANTHLCNIHENNDRKLEVFFASIQRFFNSRKPVLAAPARLGLNRR
ncbi:S-adenosylmethionine decarboxylase [Candidatus Kaiserbacteria bacterium]|nr:S-adenosylmethionine decarboxylase [Candidatus Kaiserbacteria bacterium]